MSFSPHLSPSGKLVDFHSAEFLPAEWFDLVLVLSAETHILYDRLVKRGYSQAKVMENIEAEIFQSILSDIKEEFDDKIEIWVAPNNTLAEQNELLHRIRLSLQQIEKE